MKRLTIVILLFVAATIPAQLLAHEGHEHKVMGTVTAVDASHVEIATTDGEKSTILLTKETKYLRGKTSVAAADIEVGGRIVVTVVEKDGKKMAKEVRLAVADKEGEASEKEQPYSASKAD